MSGCGRTIGIYYENRRIEFWVGIIYLGLMGRQFISDYKCYGTTQLNRLWL
jgi:hypothetical protein